MGSSPQILNTLFEPNIRPRKIIPRYANRLATNRRCTFGANPGTTSANFLFANALDDLAGIGQRISLLTFDLFKITAQDLERIPLLLDLETRAEPEVSEQR